MKKSFLFTLIILTMLFMSKRAKASISFLYNASNPSRMLTINRPQELFVGQKNIDIDYSIGGRTRGIQGKFKSSDKGVVRVSRNGSVRPIKEGVATISFIYKLNGVRTEIKCGIVVKDKIDSLTIKGDSSFDGTMPTDSILQFGYVAMVSGKRVKLNIGTDKDYGIFYEAFLDEACNNPAPKSFASITQSGFLAVGRNVGKVYIRAVVKANKKATTGIYSNVIPVEIVNRIKISQLSNNSFSISFNKTAEIKSVIVKDGENIISTNFTTDIAKNITKVTANGNLPRTATVELYLNNSKESIRTNFVEARVTDIVLNNTEAPLTSINGNSMAAEINYKLIDQFGNDVTTDPAFSGKCYAIWERNTRVELTSNGKFLIPLSVNQNVGYMGNLDIVYGGVGNINKNFTIKIANPSYIKSLEIMGIYRRDLTNYTKVMDATTFLKKGTIINSYGGTARLNTTPNSYYLLIKATDNYGNNVADALIDQSRLIVNIASNTNLALDLADGKLQSILPIEIGKEKYLTYPIKAGTLTEGLVDIRVSVPMTDVKASLSTKVIDGKNAGMLVLAGGGRVGVENLITFILYNSSNIQISQYEDVISTLGLDDYGTNQAVILPGSDIISTVTGSYFIIKKNMQTGLAEMYYLPNMAALPNGMVQNGEEVTVFRGSINERKYVLTVRLN